MAGVMTLREIIKAQVRAEACIPVPVKKSRKSGLAKRGHELAVFKLGEDVRLIRTCSNASKRRI